MGVSERNAERMIVFLVDRWVMFSVRSFLFLNSGVEQTGIYGRNPEKKEFCLRKGIRTYLKWAELDEVLVLINGI